MRLTPPAEIAARLEHLDRALAAAGLQGAILLQQADLFYLTGTIQEGALVVGAGQAPRYLVRRSLQRGGRRGPDDLRPRPGPHARRSRRVRAPAGVDRLNRLP